MQYWYNIAKGQVETDEDRGPGEDVLGPYDTADEAAHALEIARRKTEEWDAEDRAWDQGGAAAAPAEE
ncbi:MAG: methionine aminopeptidase [Actinomycetales bacterium]|nr:methionine aminopeptidase [Actinomycetales bacterium]